MAIGTDGSATVIPADASGLLVNTELPAAAALADDTSNPTAPASAAHGLIFDGTTWDRVRTLTADGAANTGIPAALLALGTAGGTLNRLWAANQIGDANAATNIAAGAQWVYNGTNYDRVRGDTANGVDVDVTRTPTVTSTTVTQVASSATNVTLKASNAARKGLTIYNDSTAVLSVKFGATASATSFTVKIGAAGFWEMQPGVVYSGIVDGIWASANGNAYVTEL